LQADEIPEAKARKFSNVDWPTLSQYAYPALGALLVLILIVYFLHNR
jgi:hypothetical protein